MAKKRGKAKRRSRKKTGVSILGVAETVMLLNVASQAAFHTNMWQFLTAKGAQGSDIITLRELIDNKSGTFYNNPNVAGSDAGASFYIMKNLRENWLGAAGMMIAIPLGFRVGKQLAKPALNRANRLLTKAKISQTVKL